MHLLPILAVFAFASGTIWADRGEVLPVNLIRFAWVWVLGSCCGLCRGLRWEFRWVFCWVLCLRIRRSPQPGKRAGGRPSKHATTHSRVGEGRRFQTGLGRGWRVASILGLAGLGFMIGFDRMEGRLGDARSDRQIVEAGAGSRLRLVEGRVGLRRPHPWGDEVELENVRALDGDEAIPDRLRLQLDRTTTTSTPDPGSRADQLIWPGAWVRMGLRVRALHPSRNPGTPNREHADARHRLGARARLAQSNWVMALPGPDAVAGIPTPSAAAAREVWRRRVAAHFEGTGQSVALVRALALGDRSGLSRELRNAFRRLGLSHLLAISGLHIGFIAAFAGWIFLRSLLLLWPRARRLGVFDWTLTLAAAAMATYAWLTQAGVSVERASLLFGLYAACRLTLRRITPVEALAWVALVILFKDPSALFDLGAQLSFTACLSLVGAGFWQSDLEVGRRGSRSLEATQSSCSRGPSYVPDDEGPALRRMLHILRSTLKASLAVSVGTAPLLAQHGLPIVLLAPLFNVAAIPWTGLVVLPTSLLAVATIDIAPRPIQKLLIMPAQILEDAATKTASLLPGPFGQDLIPMPIFVMLVAIAFHAIRNNRWRRAILIWGVVSWAGASPISLAPSMGPLPRVVFFDVGQGDAAVFQGREAVLLVDTGPGLPTGEGGANLVRGLRAVGVDRIDVVVLTHADLDHRGGLVRVFEMFPVEELWLPETEERDDALLAMAAFAEGFGTRVLWQAATPADREPWLRGDLEIDVLWPTRQGRVGRSSRNQTSMVLRVMLERRVYLMAADIDLEVERELMIHSARLEADVLKIAHHGSRNSSGAEFLARVSPSIAVLSAPCDAARGLPNALALSRIRQAGAALWWTGRDGAVILNAEEKTTIGVQSWGAPRACSPR